MFEISFIQEKTCGMGLKKKNILSRCYFCSPLCANFFRVLCFVAVTSAIVFSVSECHEIVNIFKNLGFNTIIFMNFLF